MVTKVPRYESATLGRPPPKSSFDSAKASHTKSLDRRSLRRPPVIVVTPHSPEVDLQNDEELWKPKAEPVTKHRPLNNKLSGMSKSSNELDGSTRYRDTSKLRYFGDTDMESYRSSSRPRSFAQRNGGHVARKDKYLTGRFGVFLRFKNYMAHLQAFTDNIFLIIMHILIFPQERLRCKARKVKWVADKVATNPPNDPFTSMHPL